MSAYMGPRARKGASTARFVKGAQGTANGGGANPFAVVAQQLLQTQRVDEIDAVMGFERYRPPQFSGGDASGQVPGRVGWLVNMHPVVVSLESVHGSSSGSGAGGIAGVDFYFLDEEGGGFKSTLTYDPYFFVTVTDDRMLNDVEEYLKKLLEGTLKNIEALQKEDLSLDNHLIGLKKPLIKLSFVNNNQLFEARRLLRPILQENSNTKTQRNIYRPHAVENTVGDAKRFIDEIREYDVPYHVRVSIDRDVRVGKWYNVTDLGFLECPEKVAFADPVVLAFDIETTKPPLKFPDAAVDQIMMISYMIDGDGYLITNREIISEDIEDFEYTPKPEFRGQFAIFNEQDELALLQRFFEHIRDVRPTVISTFNGDFFDWPFVETRARIHGLDMFEEIGFAADSEGEYKSAYCCHMDCFRWVKRDSYLPQGSQGLKAVTQAKLGYNPIELDPELMTPYAYTKPQQLSEYSVSDAVATYYLYMKYVHPFIFSLCSIIPLNPDEVLRKGTGTLCEMLLMVQAYKNNILLPNKHTDPIERFYDGHLLESETYVGGHVESLEAGVFRSDLKNDFTIDPTAVDELLADLPATLKFCIEKENNCSLDKVTNLEEVKEQITNSLLQLKENRKTHELPLIYHVDVASMYPNIMTTNRLQPDSIKTERDCASCDFNRPGKTCARRLKWAWRGEFFPAKMDEYNMIKRALQNETFPNKNKFSQKPILTFDELSYADQVAHIKKRLSEYSRKVYHRVKVSEVVEREAIVCQRENPFYVNTVRSFRDRRYEFKGLAKTWKGKASKIDPADKHEKDEATKMVVLYDSLQLAHKVILNSFYGYVMRKGSRWYSMEMAGITCLTGATIIQMARSLVERVGRPLELDTDGIWCILPKSFPDNYTFKLENGKKLYLSYPCSMLNYRVHQQFTNDQYQELVDPEKLKYETHSDNSIFFEVDGPYRAMILPTSKEEGKGIKKRYAVFNEDGSLAELKGFELKRRGELQLIKNFQSDIFKLFLEGDSLQNCYNAVATVANRWLDVLDTEGKMLEDEDLIELICENRSMSKTLKEYEGQKSTSITTAKRLGDFLGEEMVKDKGLQCKYIISSRPANAPVTERAIPVAIFSADIAIKRSFLRRWTADPSLDNFDIRTIIDWGYYKERLGSTIQKIITIPAALQNVENPVPRVVHPDWLKKKINTMNDKFKQTSLNRFFTKTSDIPVAGKIQDIEDILYKGTEEPRPKKLSGKVSRKNRLAKRKRDQKEVEDSLTLPKECPSMHEDYVGWLKYQKIKWKIQARDRKRRTQLFGDNNRTVDRSALGNMVRKQAETYANATWEILQYRKTNEPGVLEVHILINGKIQQLRFKIPKTVYVKLKTNVASLGPIQDCMVEKSNATLPNHPQINRYPSGSLFKLTLPELVYREELEKRSSVLNDDNVLGIFEGAVDITQHAVMELGSSVRFNSNTLGSLGKGLQNGFDMKSLNMTDNERYMSRFKSDTAYLLHFTTNIGYEFFILFKSWNEEIEIFTLKPSIQAQGITEQMITKIYSDLFEKRMDKLREFSRFIDFKETVAFNLHSFTDLNKLTRHLTVSIGKMKEEKGQQFLMLLKSPSNKKLTSKIKNLRTLPVLELATTPLTLPQLNWQSNLCSKIINQIFSCSSWVAHMVKVARYSNIPVCNLQLDNMGYVIDVLYARKLRHENIVLWWNENGPLPDLAGIEKEYDPNISGIMQELSFPDVNTPDIYDKTVLEIQIRNLTINTVLASTLINEAEGSDLTNVESSAMNSASSEKNSVFVEDAFNAESLTVLKNLLKDWWEEALNEDFTADLLVNAFISWVQNPESCLFDILLRYHVHNLTRKSLLQLLNEFNSLGSTVIFADRNKLMVKTNKFVPENCYAYSEYMVKAVKVNPLFKYIDLRIEKYWDVLIWMDKFNFGGLACSTIQDKDEQDYDAYSVWQIKNTLPPIFQTEFDDWMAIILDSMTKTKRTYFEKNMGTQRATQIIQTKKSSDGGDEEVNSLSNFTELFAKPLIKRVKKLYRNQQEFILDPQYLEDYKFPELPGLYLPLKNPLLELVKDLCQVMSLSKITLLEVRALRKELLKLFEIREFAKEAEFSNPCKNLIINEVTCRYCFHATSIDFCRMDSSGDFSCMNCHKDFDRDLLQEFLIQKLCSESDNFVSQDLHCSKCHKIKMDYMSTHCTCSGKWVNSAKTLDLENQVVIYRQVADYFKFDLLKDTIQELHQH
ncbi:DNA polymerase epsilon catalytic subunit KNAG_0F00540 [Huiozyma naganishii CBS 8797]|uniref:DNA polymerase epsilon catalytic subunit n=1 Tax=Huiozyma naganishii (strain ATCC MYA-139 / BCRC 22969 / CBS 8797 / KCTC 17520 / NBRC 10181 / NCYC 3082 / Yp74L-3) TaxID=1071383 RepID=J7RME7_HUIN7|nr:hypothetical protein KNAG_0F00540 [Kazachstania naganishii CBS 8797]CCK70723.1 hypothetical protein KNAG_0F00540 [Kazachstania naganishii CBS 8797]